MHLSVENHRMLTRKQFWRKARGRLLSISRSTARLEKEVEEAQKQLKDAETVFKISTDFSDNQIEHEKGSQGVKKTGAKKSIRFSSKVYVLLIPTRQELSNYSNHLYWSDKDYPMFKKEAVDEIRSILMLRKCSAKEAILFLYQPRPSDNYDQDENTSSNPHDSNLRKDPNTAMVLDDMKIRNADVSVDGHSQSNSPGSVTSSDISSPEDNIDGSNEMEIVVENNPDAAKPWMGNHELSESCLEQEHVHALAFMKGVKTDIELNRDRSQAEGSSMAASPDASNMPHRTPSGSSAQNPNVWMVQWKKSTALPPGATVADYM